VVEGFLTGLHQSPYHGFSVEFAEYRQYIPGEPTTHLDWRLYARTDRHYRKVFAEETNLRATLLVDCSASMGFTADPARPSKLAYARVLAAALAYLLLRQNDAVGLVTFDEKPLAMVPARSMRRQLFPLLKTLEATPPGAGTALGPVLHAVAERVHRRGLVILLSDLMDDPAAVLAGLKHFRHRGHEVVVFQILDPRERDLDFRRELELTDLERPQRKVRIEPSQAAADYRAQFGAWRDALRRDCRRHLVDLIEIGTDAPPEAALHAWLGRRRRRL
jgi:uncharacterized protein (DUF58 family)